MYALLLATLCLLPVSTIFAQADSAVPTGTTLEVYVKGQDASTPDVMRAMSAELGALMQPGRVSSESGAASAIRPPPQEPNTW